MVTCDGNGFPHRPAVTPRDATGAYLHLSLRLLARGLPSLEISQLFLRNDNIEPRQMDRTTRRMPAPLRIRDESSLRPRPVYPHGRVKHPTRLKPSDYLR